jgi:hypothetical protein
MSLLFELLAGPIYYLLDNRNRAPKIVVSSSCYEFIREMQRAQGISTKYSFMISNLRGS